MKKMMISISLLGILVASLSAATIDRHGEIHYLPDAAKNIKPESLESIPHIVEKNGVISTINGDGAVMAMKIDKNIDPEFIKNFNRIFSMQTGGQRRVDKVVILRPIPKTNIKLVVYIVNGSIIPAFATKDGTAMFNYSPIITGHGLNRYNYAYIDTLIAQTKQIGEAINGESRYAKLAISLKDNKYIYRIKKGNGVENGTYYFADPMCPKCKKEIDRLKNSEDCDTTIIFMPALRKNGVESIIRSAFIIQELSENNTTSPDEIIDTMLSYFVDGGSYATGALPEKKYLHIVRDMMKEFLPATQNEVPFTVPYDIIHDLQNKIAFKKNESLKN